MPQIWNPKSGFVFNSNNTPFVATAPEDNLKPSDFPAWMGIQTNMTNRACRALENLGADPSITAEAFRKYKFDLTYAQDSELMANVRKLIALPSTDPDVKMAQDILRPWDRTTDIAQSRHRAGRADHGPVMRAQQTHGAPIALRGRAEEGDRDPQDPFRPPRSGMGRGQPHRARQARSRHRWRAGHLSRRLWRAAARRHLHGVAGDTLIMFVTWDKDGKVSAQSINPYGATESHPNSPHYNDQLKDFVAMKTKPVWFTDAELKGHIEASYSPGQAHTP